jgi:hypothetical protein
METSKRPHGSSWLSNVIEQAAGAPTIIGVARNHIATSAWIELLIQLLVHGV